MKSAKKIVTPFLCLICMSLVLFLAECKKSDPGNTNTTTSTCSDGIIDNGEVGVDCGGPCSQCYTDFTANIDGQSWRYESYTAIISGNNLVIDGKDQSNMEIHLVIAGPLATGTTNLVTGTLYKDGNASSFWNITSGTVTIAALNSSAKVITGSFSYACHNPGVSPDHSITNGVLKNIFYN